MSEEIYCNMPPQIPPQLQGCEQYELPEKKGLSNYHLRDLSPLSLWKIIAVSLGIICLALLLSVGLLAAKLNQSSLNASNVFYNKEENETVLKYPTCYYNWHQRGDNCYYFLKNKRVWKECAGLCSDLDARFLKVDTEDEMNFVIKSVKMQCDLNEEKYFISLYYNNTQSKWVWLDGTDLTLHKFPILGHQNPANECIHIKYEQLNAADCLINGYCVCKKKIYS